MSHWKKKKNRQKKLTLGLTIVVDVLEIFWIESFFFNYPTPPLSFLLTVPTSLVQITFSPQPSSAAKIKDDGYNFTMKTLSTRVPKSSLL